MGVGWQGGKRNGIFSKWNSNSKQPSNPLSELQVWVLSHVLPDEWMHFTDALIIIYGPHTLSLLSSCYLSPQCFCALVLCVCPAFSSSAFIFLSFFFFEGWGNSVHIIAHRSHSVVVLFEGAGRREMFEEHQRQKHCFNLIIIRLRAQCTCNIFLRKYSWECSR